MSDDPNMDAYIAQQRASFDERRSSLISQRDEATRTLDEQIAKVERELASLSAYEGMRSGKLPVNATATRAGRGARREQILRVLRDAPLGLTRRDLLDAMGATKNRSAAATISNALNGMHRVNAVVRDNNGRWSLPPESLAGAPKQTQEELAAQQPQAAK